MLATKIKGGAMSKGETVFTVGDLTEWLQGIPKSTELIFQGDLTFYRIKRRGENLVQMEFNQKITVEEF